MAAFGIGRGRHSLKLRDLTAGLEGFSDRPGYKSRRQEYHRLSLVFQGQRRFCRAKLHRAPSKPFPGRKHRLTLLAGLIR
jgi:hypothetical protein